MIRDFSFSTSNLKQLNDKMRTEYQEAQPFPHVVIDGFLPEPVLDALLDEFPKPQDIEWYRYGSEAVKKLQLPPGDEEHIGPFTRHLLHEFNAAGFITFLESLTGIDGLIPDPYFKGGGLHQIERGGYLKIHADFNLYDKLRLDRRINAILYLNRDWQEEYGGHLELWNRDMTRCEQRILPLLNRLVVFNTTDFSYHGHPDPLTCPEGVTRKSLALYYYSNGRPEEEKTAAHRTLFQKRPQDQYDAINWDNHEQK